jgi:hypothetical protein
MVAGGSGRRGCSFAVTYLGQAPKNESHIVEACRASGTEKRLREEATGGRRTGIEGMRAPMRGAPRQRASSSGCMAMHQAGRQHSMPRLAPSGQFCSKECTRQGRRSQATCSTKREPWLLPGGRPAHHILMTVALPVMTESGVRQVARRETPRDSGSACKRRIKCLLTGD